MPVLPSCVSTYFLGTLLPRHPENKLGPACWIMRRMGRLTPVPQLPASLR